MQKINNNTFDLKTILPDTVRDDVEVIVGGDDPNAFIPHIKLSRWNGEGKLSVYLANETHSDPIIEGDTAKWIKPDKEVHFFEKGHKRIKRKNARGPYSHQLHGSAEFDVILNNKPASNILTFNIDCENLDFFYQPPLTDAEKESMEIDRPPEVIGSYAVYHKSLKNNQYQTGKLCHIYRPEVTDTNGTMVYGDLNVDTNANILTVTVPQSFIDTAIYPIHIDPNFGFETAGGTVLQAGNANYWGSLFTGTTGTGTSVSLYRTGVQTDSHFYSIYLHSNLGLVAQTSPSTTPVNGSYETINLTTSPNLSATDYLLMFETNGNGKITSIETAYDTGATNQGHRDNTSTYSSTAKSTLGTITHSTNKISIYATYTASGGTVITPKVIMF
jgi:hypothetical protein